MPDLRTIVKPHVAISTLGSQKTSSLATKISQSGHVAIKSPKKFLLGEIWDNLKATFLAALPRKLFFDVIIPRFRVLCFVDHMGLCNRYRHCHINGARNASEMSLKKCKASLSCSEDGALALSRIFPPQSQALFATRIGKCGHPAILLVALYRAMPRDYLSDTPLLRAMGFFGVSNGQLGAIPPPPFLSVSPLESMRSGGAIPPPPPPKEGYLSAKWVRHPPLRYYLETVLHDRGSISHWAAKAILT